MDKFDDDDDDDDGDVEQVVLLCTGRGDGRRKRLRRNHAADGISQMSIHKTHFTRSALLLPVMALSYTKFTKYHDRYSVKQKRTDIYIFSVTNKVINVW